MNILGWVWFVVVQLIMFVFTVVGWVLLIPFCLTQAWFRGTVALVSIKDQRPIDAWKWNVLNYVYGNPEDGVSGQTALIWVNGVLSPYMPNPWREGAGAPIGVVGYLILFFTWSPETRDYLWDAWRAYCWSAWRNSCDALKYRFAWNNGPQAEILGVKLGWWPENGYKVPLL